MVCCLVFPEQLVYFVMVIAVNKYVRLSCNPCVIYLYRKGGNTGGDGGNEVNAVPSGGGGAKVEGNRMEFMVQPEYGYGYMPGYPGYMPSYPGYGYPGYGYGYGHPHPHGHGHCYPAYVPNYPVFVHPPHQMFNDENPNACAIL